MKNNLCSVLVVLLLGVTFASAAPEETLKARHLQEITNDHEASLTKQEAKNAELNIDAKAMNRTDCAIEYPEVLCCIPGCKYRCEDNEDLDWEETLKCFHECHDNCYNCWCDDDTLACCEVYGGYDCPSCDDECYGYPCYSGLSSYCEEFCCHDTK